MFVRHQCARCERCQFLMSDPSPAHPTFHCSLWCHLMVTTFRDLRQRYDSATGSVTGLGPHTCLTANARRVYVVQFSTSPCSRFPTGELTNPSQAVGRLRHKRSHETRSSPRLPLPLPDPSVYFPLKRFASFSLPRRSGLMWLGLQKPRPPRTKGTKENSGDDRHRRRVHPPRPAAC